MKKKIVGLSEYAVDHLNAFDCKIVNECIGTLVERNADVAEIDGEEMVMLVTGQLFHICFLELE